jgi:FkbM family methyltransferase
VSLLDSKTFIDFSNLVAKAGIKYFIETDAKGSAEGLEAAARLNLHAYVCDTTPRGAEVLAQRYPNFDLYDGNSDAFLLAVLPKLDGPAFFLIEDEEQAKVIEAASGDNDWHFDFKHDGSVVQADGTVTPLSDLIPDANGFIRQWAGPPELKPRMYRTQSEKDTWYAVAFENEYKLGPLNAEDLVVDIGMNIGAFCHIAHRMGSRNIIGFEPSAHYYKAALANLEGLEGVHPNLAAVVRSDNPPKTVFHDGAMSTLCDEGTEVEAVSLDQLIDDLGPIRFLKIDCEGSEFPILYTCTKLDQIQEIAGEYHENINFRDDSLPPTKIIALAKFLFDQGFTRIDYTDNVPGIGNFFCRRSVKHESNPNYSLGN